MTRHALPQGLLDSGRAIAHARLCDGERDGIVNLLRLLRAHAARHDALDR